VANTCSLRITEADEGHGNGIGFLTGRTAQHQHADRFVTALIQEFGKNLAPEYVKKFPGCEKTRHANERIRLEGIEFLGIASKEFSVRLAV
jgi:hypothetical protein